MSQITQAIAARQTRITQLQSEIDTLQRAARIVAPPTKAAAKPQPKAMQKRATWSAADRAAISKRMKAYWAKRRKAKG